MAGSTTKTHAPFADDPDQWVPYVRAIVRRSRRVEWRYLEDAASNALLYLLRARERVDRSRSNDEVRAFMRMWAQRGMQIVVYAERSILSGIRVEKFYYSRALPETRAKQSAALTGRIYDAADGPFRATNLAVTTDDLAHEAIEREDERSLAIRTLMRIGSLRDAAIMAELLSGEMTLTEVAQEFGLHKQTVARIRTRSIRAIRKELQIDRTKKGGRR